MADPRHLRKDYQVAALDRAGLPDDPRTLFERWFEDAVAARLDEPHGMALATVEPDGRPSCRIVLMRGVDARGLTFFTNHGSGKARALRHEPRAAATFWWGALERQVRIEGDVTPLHDAESDAYWSTRPRQSQLAAWASPQSETVADRAWLEAQIEAFALRFPDTMAIPRPACWGGYLLRPRTWEFWQGRPARTHDRFRFTRDADGNHSVVRLAP